MKIDPRLAQIRLYQHDDQAAIAEICARTIFHSEGEPPEDPTTIAEADRLTAYVYALPYTVLEPELVFVAETEGRVVGYILGTSNTHRFVDRITSEWIPQASGLLPLLEGEPTTRIERLRRALHHPEYMLQPHVADYPAHLHIDLLPEAQGLGLGRQLMTSFLDALAAQGVPSVHLGVARENLGARAFYHKLGFHEIPYSSDTSTVRLGRHV
jgi:ribosomal protein S18 acetylase RimI-like enzyme